MSVVKNIAQFRNTLQIVADGGYELDGARIAFRHTAEALAQARYWPEAEVLELANDDACQARRYANCVVRVSNEDSFSGAFSLTAQSEDDCDISVPLVLNFANPHVPGGGVKTGASAQEEDLCRKSTLYFSLKSDNARPFYQNNLSSDKHYFTHGVLVSPHVEVFRDAKGHLLSEPYSVAVMTVPAPYAKGLKGKDAELRETIEVRIRGMLNVAVRCGYSRLVLGAWGCGAFGNDPEVVAGAFITELERHGVDFSFHRGGAPAGFEQIRFAILDKSPATKTYQSFARQLTGW